MDKILERPRRRVVRRARGGWLNDPETAFTDATLLNRATEWPGGLRDDNR